MYTKAHFYLEHEYNGMFYNHLDFLLFWSVSNNGEFCLVLPEKFKHPTKLAINTQRGKPQLNAKIKKPK